MLGGIKTKLFFFMHNIHHRVISFHSIKVRVKTALVSEFIWRSKPTGANFILYIYRSDKHCCVSVFKGIVDVRLYGADIDGWELAQVYESTANARLIHLKTPDIVGIKGAERMRERTCWLTTCNLQTARYKLHHHPWAYKKKVLHFICFACKDLTWQPKYCKPFSVVRFRI